MHRFRPHAIALVLLVAATAAADTRIVTVSHTDGFTVMVQEGTVAMPMAGVEVATSERTESIDELDPPEGHYGAPPDYRQVEFDLMATLGGQGGA